MKTHKLFWIAIAGLAIIQYFLYRKLSSGIAHLKNPSQPSSGAFVSPGASFPPFLSDRLSLEQRLLHMQIELEKMRAQIQDKGVGENETNTMSRQGPDSTSVHLSQEGFEGAKDRLASFQKDFVLYDSDRNGEIDISESNLSVAALSLYDFDGDGTIGKRDLDRTDKLLHNAQKQAERKDSKDKKFPIEKENYAGSKKEFRFVDHNEDGQVDENEYFTYLKIGWQEKRRFDTDLDGNISQQEFGGGVERFKALDKNKDGLLDDGEVRSAMFSSRW